MSNYRRVKVKGACYFFTVVTYKRSPILTDDLARGILKGAFKQVQTDYPFKMQAFCILPNHLHCIWKMPPGDCDYSKRWSIIKRIFSKRYIAQGGKSLPQTNSRQNKRELGIWQRRFWEHRLRDEDDCWRHIHYIHCNPVKHGLTERIEDWQYSTYHRYCKTGAYDQFDWHIFNADDLNEKYHFDK